jgi:hypothetical protein
MPDKSKAKVFLRMLAGKEERYVISPYAADENPGRAKNLS